MAKELSSLQIKLAQARGTKRFSPIKFWDSLTLKQRDKVILLIWDEGLYYTPEYHIIPNEICNKNGNNLSSEFKKILSRLRV